MNAQADSARFFIWGLDESAYGPVELPTLVSWIKDDRVFADTWIFVEREVTWRRAADIPELQMFFPRKADCPAVNASASIKPAALRRVKILAGFSDAQLQHFAQYTEWQRVPQWTVVVKQGEQGDTMYLILEGELRVRLVVGGKETILATLGPGEFFGDMALFDRGPRSADVVANVDSTMLKISASDFAKLTEEAPDLAAPFLLAASKTLAARIRADNKRLRDSVSFSNAAGT
ncbi:MAG: cyclic nucleotide-binding domain-containing protein [Verrucomicrobiota bacterium]